MVALPISKTQMGKLGERLRDAPEPEPPDLELLKAVLAAYREALQIVNALLRELGFHPVSRLKITGTIVGKLRRDRRSSLRTIQDLAGSRVVLDADLIEQDQAVQAFCEALERRGFGQSVIDRRADPRSGYRAVHVVAKIDGVPVEIQFRTELQHLWAQMFERLADLWGRQIRYDGEPDRNDRADGAWDIRGQMVADFLSFSQDIAITEAQFVDAKAKVADGARAVGSDYGEAAWDRRRAVEIVRTAFATLADAAEREGRPR
ncbi:RelA/SpoT domain-containing protein [Paractinoplanes lichenicola]|uniref:RelA/SpoT domain-containing protein n=1 Tax=Paractinoplanes lichenicola TaxID=2802976 RepID=A0ABS1VN35_9ACTN|nr:RelA/SpoT domain-containing protein [Actinoplanes lichenicola]MBL7256070.1 RelA/SpoT domain-containing protein [Actinoplanes lichenicola]